MALTFASNEYQIPRGRTFFDPYDANDALTGERFLGNCPGLTLTVATEKADHYSSESGLRQKDKSVIVQVDRTGKLNCDNMSLENVGMFFSGTAEAVAQTSASVSNEAHTVKQGRYYQLGQSSSNPAGAKNVTSVVVTDVAGTTTHVLGTDYNLDAASGRIQILAGGIADDEVIHVDYSRPVAAWERIKTGDASEIKGALRVISDNASGNQRDYYMPYVSLTPDGEIPIIAEGTDYASMGFGIEVLKPANAEAIYVDGRPA